MTDAQIEEAWRMVLDRKAVEVELTTRTRAAVSTFQGIIIDP